MVTEIRSHLDCMTVDLPTAERRQLGVGDDLAEVLRERARPELLLVDAGDYSPAYLSAAAALLIDAGAVPGPLRTG